MFPPLPFEGSVALASIVETIKIWRCMGPAWGATEIFDRLFSEFRLSLRSAVFSEIVRISRVRYKVPLEKSKCFGER